MSTIYVFGHQNPDNDSVSSAVSYAYLKNRIDPDNTYVPARLGAMPKETAWVFGEYGIDTPVALPHVHNRVMDAMTSQVVSIPNTATMLEAGRLFREDQLNAIPVVDAQGVYLGVLTLRALADLYTAESSVTGFHGLPVSLGNLGKSIAADMVVGNKDLQLAGNLVIAASEPQTMVSMVAPGDTVILGDRLRTQPLAIEAGASCIILTCGARPTPELEQLARQHDCALLCTEYDTYTATRFASLSQTVSDFVDSGIPTCQPDDLLSEAKELILVPPYRQAVVLDPDNRPMGILTRGDVARARRREVILVDHNESAQSAPGILEAKVCGIVDHHRVGDIQTANPICFLCLPLGSTATIVTREFQHQGVDIPVPIAAALLSAVMTDTVLLKSPTTTPTDHEVAATLGAIIGRDPLEYGMEVIRSRSAGVNLKASDIIGLDAKEFRFGDNVVVIAQHETVDLKSVLDREPELVSAMNEAIEQRGLDSYLLMVTDIIAEGSQFICAGKQRLVERAFDVDFSAGSVFMPGILSRKKQVAGRLIDFGV